MNLQPFFAPRSIALIGASADPLSISARPLRMLAQHGYAGALYPVNPKYSEIDGRPVYASIDAVPAPVDLAMVAVPAVLVPRVPGHHTGRELRPANGRARHSDHAGREDLARARAAGANHAGTQRVVVATDPGA